MTQRRFIITYAEHSTVSPVVHHGIWTKDNRVEYFHTQQEANKVANALAERLPTGSYVFTSEVLEGGCVYGRGGDGSRLCREFYAPRP